MNKVLRWKKQSVLGFTILELLVALSIFAVVMVMVTSGLSVVLDLRAKMKIRDQRIHQLQFAMLLLERDFLQMVQYGEKVPSLTYRGSGPIEFIRMGAVNPMGRHARSTLQRVNYSLTGDALVRSATFNLMLNSGQENASHSVPILYGVEDFKVQFWTHKKIWIDQWPEKNKNLRAQNQPLQINSEQKFLPSAVLFILKMKEMGVISRVFSIPLGDYHVFP